MTDLRIKHTICNFCPKGPRNRSETKDVSAIADENLSDMNQVEMFMEEKNHVMFIDVHQLPPSLSDSPHEGTVTFSKMRDFAGFLKHLGRCPSNFLHHVPPQKILASICSTTITDVELHLLVVLCQRQQVLLKWPLEPELGSSSSTSVSTGLFKILSPALLFMIVPIRSHICGAYEYLILPLPAILQSQFEILIKHNASWITCAAQRARM